MKITREELQEYVEEQLKETNQKFNQELFDKLMDEVDNECHPSEEIDAEIFIWYSDYVYENCEHEDYEIEEEEDYNGRNCQYAACPHCGRTGSVWTNMTSEGPEQEIDWK